MRTTKFRSFLNDKFQLIFLWQSLKNCNFNRQLCRIIEHFNHRSMYYCLSNFFNNTSISLFMLVRTNNFCTRRHPHDLAYMMNIIWIGHSYFIMFYLVIFNKISRSEEHTSELQSRFDLVCRLLLEKKKNKYTVNLLRIC